MIKLPQRHLLSRPAWRRLAWLGTLLVVASCATSGPVLNSERIEVKFGSYGVDVIRAQNDLRVSSLYSDTGENKITRTFAVVRFSSRINAAIEREHAAVLSGESLGAVFKSAGWRIEKHNMFVGELPLRNQHAMVADLMQIGIPNELAAHVYLFVVSKDNDSYSYATIIELHHPDYLSVADLSAIYGEVIFDDSARTEINDFIEPTLWENQPE